MRFGRFSTESLIIDVCRLLTIKLSAFSVNNLDFG